VKGFWSPEWSEIDFPLYTGQYLTQQLVAIARDIRYDNQEFNVEFKKYDRQAAYAIT